MALIDLWLRQINTGCDHFERLFMGNLDLKFRLENLSDGSSVAIVEMKGSIDGSTVKKFEAETLALAQKGYKYLILNFREIGYMNSTGLGILVKVLDRYQEKSGDMKLVQVPKKVSDLFDMLGISSILNIYPSMEDALNSLPVKVVPKTGGSEAATAGGPPETKGKSKTPATNTGTRSSSGSPSRKTVVPPPPEPTPVASKNDDNDAGGGILIEAEEAAEIPSGPSRQEPITNRKTAPPSPATPAPTMDESMPASIDLSGSLEEIDLSAPASGISISGDDGVETGIDLSLSSSEEPERPRAGFQPPQKASAIETIEEGGIDLSLGGDQEGLPVMEPAPSPSAVTMDTAEGIDLSFGDGEEKKEAAAKLDVGIEEISEELDEQSLEAAPGPDLGKFNAAGEAVSGKKSAPLPAPAPEPELSDLPPMEEIDMGSPDAHTAPAQRAAIDAFVPSGTGTSMTSGQKSSTPTHQPVAAKTPTGPPEIELPAESMVGDSPEPVAPAKKSAEAALVNAIADAAKEMDKPMTPPKGVAPGSSAYSAFGMAPTITVPAPPMPMLAGGHLASGEKVAAPAKSAPTTPVAPAEPLKRKSTVRYYERMNPFKAYPLSVALSKESIKQVKLERVAQTESSKVIEVARAKPEVTIAPCLPGCLVTPPSVTLDVTPETASAEFWVTPVIEADISGWVEIHYQGKVVDKILLTTKSTKQTLAKIGAAGAILSPVISYMLDGLHVNLAKGFGDLITKVQGSVGLLVAGLSSMFLFLILGVVFYLRNRPKEAEVIETFFTVDPVKK